MCCLKLLKIIKWFRVTKRENSYFNLRNEKISFGFAFCHFLTLDAVWKSITGSRSSQVYLRLNHLWGGAKRTFLFHALSLWQMYRPFNNFFYSWFTVDLAGMQMINLTNKRGHVREFFFGKIEFERGSKPKKLFVQKTLVQRFAQFGIGCCFLFLWTFSNPF